MATKPMGQLGGTPRVVAMQPKCHPTQQIVCLEFLAEVCQNSTPWAVVCSGSQLSTTAAKKDLAQLGIMHQDMDYIITNLFVP